MQTVRITILFLLLATGFAAAVAGVDPIDPSDVDGDGESQALTDGLLFVRYLFGFRGATLITGAVDLDHCTRCTAPPIEDYLAAMGGAALVCPAGTFDRNGFFDDGCEFTLDTDAVYVSNTAPGAANDGTCGLGPLGTGAGNHPCSTIGQGQTRAGELGRSQVKVSHGTYAEAVTLVNGRSVRGSHEPGTWAQNLAVPSTILTGVSVTGIHDRSVVAIGITSTTVFEGFQIFGSINAKPSGNSYGIYVSNSNGNLTLQNNVIIGGSGGPGGNGTPGPDGADGGDGIGRGFSADPSVYDGKVATGTGVCNVSNDRAFTNGSVAVCGASDNVSGGNGGSVLCPALFGSEGSSNDGVAGQPANGGAAGGAGGDAGEDVLVCTGGVTAGLKGAAGGVGTKGAGGSGCASPNGSVVAGHWVAASGSSGAAGSSGAGGGGGGSGSGAQCSGGGCLDGKDRLGGHGGGGGAGGCGADFGAGGFGGGGWFGIFVSGGSAPTIIANTIYRGVGGLGGDGGTGGVGGDGGDGGDIGGLTGGILCVGVGGGGGAGGAGGHGGGGGGGCGGGAFGFYTTGVGSPTYCANNVVTSGGAGPGGSGGQSLGNPGGSGAAGTLTGCSFN